MKRTIFYLIMLLLTANLNASVIVIGDLLREHEANPGDKYQEEILLRNTSDNAEEVSVFITDYQTFADGQAFFDKQPGLRSNAPWISLDGQRFLVPAKSMVKVDLKISIPNKALEGSFWSCVMIENSPAKMGGGTVVVDIVNRYAVQVVTHIKKTGKKVIEFLNTSFDRETKTLSCDIENAGTRHFRALLWAELRTGNKRPLRFLTPMKSLYPGSSVRYSLELPALGPGKYLARLFIDSGHEGERWSKELWLSF